MAAERPEDVDEEFNRIVSGIGPGWGKGLPAWPDPPSEAEPAALARTHDAPSGLPPGNEDHDPTEAAPVPRGADPEEHFKPAPPPPLPHPDPVTALCWLLVLGAPVLLTILALAGWYVPRWTLALVGLGFVGGVVTLVLRLEDRPRDTDDGAVV